MVLEAALNSVNLAEIYLIAPYFWDGLLFTIFFVGLAHSVFKKLYEDAGKWVGIAVGLALAVGLAMAEYRLGWYIGSQELSVLPIAALLFILGYLLYALLHEAAGMSVSCALSISYLLVYGLLEMSYGYTLTQAVAGYQTIEFVLLITLAAAIISLIICLVRAIPGMGGGDGDGDVGESPAAGGTTSPRRSRQRGGGGRGEGETPETYDRLSITIEAPAERDRVFRPGDEVPVRARFSGGSGDYQWALQVIDGRSGNVVEQHSGRGDEVSMQLDELPIGMYSLRLTLQDRETGDTTMASRRFLIREEDGGAEGEEEDAQARTGTVLLRPVWQDTGEEITTGTVHLWLSEYAEIRAPRLYRRRARETDEGVLATLEGVAPHTYYAFGAIIVEEDGHEAYSDIDPGEPIEVSAGETVGPVDVEFPRPAWMDEEEAEDDEEAEGEGEEESDEEADVDYNGEIEILVKDPDGSPTAPADVEDIYVYRVTEDGAETRVENPVQYVGERDGAAQFFIRDLPIPADEGEASAYRAHATHTTYGTARQLFPRSEEPVALSRSSPTGNIVLRFEEADDTDEEREEDTDEAEEEGEDTDETRPAEDDLSEPIANLAGAANRYVNEQERFRTAARALADALATHHSPLRDGTRVSKEDLATHAERFAARASATREVQDQAERLTRALRDAIADATREQLDTLGNVYDAYFSTAQDYEDTWEDLLAKIAAQYRRGWEAPDAVRQALRAAHATISLDTQTSTHASYTAWMMKTLKDEHLTGGFSKRARAFKNGYKTAEKAQESIAWQRPDFTSVEEEGEEDEPESGEDYKMRLIPDESLNAEFTGEYWEVERVEERDGPLAYGFVIETEGFSEDDVTYAFRAFYRDANGQVHRLSKNTIESDLRADVMKGSEENMLILGKGRDEEWNVFAATPTEDGQPPQTLGVDMVAKALQSGRELKRRLRLTLHNPGPDEREEPPEPIPGDITIDDATITSATTPNEPVRITARITGSDGEYVYRVLTRHRAHQEQPVEALARGGRLANGEDAIDETITFEEYGRYDVTLVVQQRDAQDTYTQTVRVSSPSTPRRTAKLTIVPSHRDRHPVKYDEDDLEGDGHRIRVPHITIPDLLTNDTPIVFDFTREGGNRGDQVEFWLRVLVQDAQSGEWRWLSNDELDTLDVGVVAQSSTGKTSEQVAVSGNKWHKVEPITSAKSAKKLQVHLGEAEDPRSLFELLDLSPGSRLRFYVFGRLLDKDSGALVQRPTGGPAKARAYYEVAYQSPGAS